MKRQGAHDALLLDLVGDLMAMLDLDELRPGMLEALMRAVPAKWASLNEMTPDGVVSSIATPELEQEWFDKFAELAHENPLYQYHASNGDGRAYRFSDVSTRKKLKATTLFREVYAPLGVNHQIAFTLPSDAGRVLAIALSREDRDFSDAERDFLNRARPFLIQAYRNALAYSRPKRMPMPALDDALRRAGLTPRQAEVMRLVALGGSNSEVALSLGLSARTVQKHLEHGFRKLGVNSRSAVAARAFTLASD